MVFWATEVAAVRVTRMRRDNTLFIGLLLFLKFYWSGLWCAIPENYEKILFTILCCLAEKSRPRLAYVMIWWGIYLVRVVWCIDPIRTRIFIPCHFLGHEALLRALSKYTVEIQAINRQLYN